MRPLSFWSNVEEMLQAKSHRMVVDPSSNVQEMSHAKWACLTGCLCVFCLDFVSNINPRLRTKNVFRAVQGDT